MTAAATATPSWRAHAAEDNDREHQGGFAEGEELRTDEALPRSEERSGEAAEHRAHGKGSELGIGGIDAERAAGDLILTQRFPGAADRQSPQPQRYPVGQQRKRENEIIKKYHAMRRRVVQAERRGKPFARSVEWQAEERRARNSGDAVRPAGETLPVEQDKPDDLAEAERDDGEIIAAQAQHRKAEQYAGKRGEDAGERQADPERQAEGLRDQRVGVGADGVERDITEIEEAREADDDVQAEAQHRVGDDQDAQIEQIAVGVKDDRKDHRKDQKGESGVA